MKRIVAVGMAAVAAVVLGSIGVATAGDSATVAVSATVAGNCKFVAPKTGAIAFGSLDPAVGTDVNGVATQPQFWCTKGTVYAISDDNGANESGTTYRMQHATLAEYIPYTFSYTATGTGTGAGVGNYISMDIAGLVLGADYVVASAGNYTDTVTLTITP